MDEIARLDDRPPGTERDEDNDDEEERMEEDDKPSSAKLMPPGPPPGAPPGLPPGLPPGRCYLVLSFLTVPVRGLFVFDLLCRSIQLLYVSSR